MATVSYSLLKIYTPRRILSSSRTVTIAHSTRSCSLLLLYACFFFCSCSSALVRDSYVTSKNLRTWMMSSSNSKDANDGLGRCHCVEKGLEHPADATTWKVWDGQAFKTQHSIHVIRFFTYSKMFGR